MTPTIELLTAIGVPGKVSLRVLPHLIDTCNKYAINTPERFVSFFSQLEHESGELYYTEELASGDAYDTRTDLGNTPEKDGDGRLYKGRGFIQITGKTNYSLLSKEFGVDFIKNPTLLGGKNITLCSDEQIKWAMLSAGWFWNKAGLNALSDKLNLKVKISQEPNLSTHKLITRRINGGYNGLLDRQIQFEQIRTYLIINKIAA